MPSSWLNMLPSHHALAAVAVAVPLRLSGWKLSDLALFGAGAVLIDVDHYISYAWRTGDFSLLRAYRHHRLKFHNSPVRRLALAWHFPFWGGYGRPFHAIPVLALLGVAAARWPWLRPLAWGVLHHRLTDWLWESFWKAQVRPVRPER